jgi:hypothetical protein
MQSQEVRKLLAQLFSPLGQFLMNGQSREVRKLLAQLFSHLGQLLMNGHAVSGSQETFSTALETFRIILDERSQHINLRPRQRMH